MQPGLNHRVMFLTNGYPDFPDSFRGHFVRRMALGLADQGYPILVVTPRIYRASPLFEQDQRDIRVFRFPFPSGNRPLIQRTTPPYGPLAVYLAGGLRCAIQVGRQYPCALIHVHWVVPPGLIGICAGRILGVPVLVHAMGTDVHTAGRRNVISRMLTRWVLRRAHGLAAVSHDLARDMKTLAPTCGPIAVIPNGIDLTCFQPRDRSMARKHLGLPESQRLIAYAGGLLPSKGLPDLQKVLDPLFHAYPELGVVFAGDGPLRDSLERWKRTVSGGGRIHILGPVPHHRMPWVFNASDLFVLPSLNEGLPNALLEAMASGLPCVASSVGDVPRVIEPHHSGLLVPPGDPGALHDALARLLEQPHFARRLAGQARSRVLAFDEQARFREVSQLYRRLLEGIEKPFIGASSR